jgi:hypothetical protein
MYTTITIIISCCYFAILNGSLGVQLKKFFFENIHVSLRMQMDYIRLLRGALLISLLQLPKISTETESGTFVSVPSCSVMGGDVSLIDSLIHALS